MERQPYPSNIRDEEWAFVAPYLTMMLEDAPQRLHSWHEVFNGLCWLVRARTAWRLMPHDLPPEHTVYQQSQRWFKAGVFDHIVHDLREAAGRHVQPCAAIFDSRTLQSTPESGTRAGYDGAKRRRGSKVYVAVDTLGHHLLALRVSAADVHDRQQVGQLAAQVQHETGDAVEMVFVDQGYTGQLILQVSGRLTGCHLQGNLSAGWCRNRPTSPPWQETPLAMLSHGIRKSQVFWQPICRGLC